MDLIREIRGNPLLWLLVFVPALFVTEAVRPQSHALLFALSILSIVPFAVLISRATEAVVAKTGDTIGALFNATLGNLTELIVALTALRAAQYDLVKASLAGAIVTKILVTMGASFLIGGLHHHIQHYNRDNARLQAGLLFLATVALLVPSVLIEENVPAQARFADYLSFALSLLLIALYALNMVFSLKTHRDLLGSLKHDTDEKVWPVTLAIIVLLATTVLVAMISEVFVTSVQSAGEAFGMTPIFVGFVIVALVNSVAELAPALSGARKDRLDLSVGIALGGASQITLFVTPMLVLLSYLIGPTPMTLHFWPGAVAMILIATMAAALVTSSGRSAWFIGIFILSIYLIFALTLYLLPPQPAA